MTANHSERPTAFVFAIQEGIRVWPRPLPMTCLVVKYRPLPDLWFVEVRAGKRALP